MSSSTPHLPTPSADLNNNLEVAELSDRRRLGAGVGHGDARGHQLFRCDPDRMAVGCRGAEPAGAHRCDGVVVRALRRSLPFSVQCPARALFAAVVALLASPVWESVRL